MPSKRSLHPSPPPLRPNGLLTVGIITACWVVALVFFLIFRDHLERADRWWTWVCAAGVVLGLCGMAYFARRPYRH